jgi:hypothetical protein
LFEKAVKKQKTPQSLTTWDEKIRDTTQIDRQSSPLHSVFSRQTDGSNHLAAFFRRLRSVLHVSPTAVLSPTTTLFEREIHATVFINALCFLLNTKIFYHILARVSIDKKEKIFPREKNFVTAPCFIFTFSAGRAIMKASERKEGSR